MAEIEASSEVARTSKPTGRSLNRGYGGLGLGIFSALLVIVSWAVYRHIQPPPPNICGTPNGPPVTAPRVQLRDGRFLAYKEGGVDKRNAKYKIISIHGYGFSRHAMIRGLSEVDALCCRPFVVKKELFRGNFMNVSWEKSEGLEILGRSDIEEISFISPSLRDKRLHLRELISELQIYFVGFDRAGYGQSTPFPQRSVKSDAYDVQDLADALELGPTFYVAANSIGGITAYGLMKYLPHRLAGLAMSAPVSNPWWAGLPSAINRASFAKRPLGYRLAVRVAHYAPWLVHWYMTQTFLPTLKMANPEKPFTTSSTAQLEKSRRVVVIDMQRSSEYYQKVHALNLLEPFQQGKDESLFRDMRMAFGTWEFSPLELENPFATRNGSVHIWQGDHDALVSCDVQREVARALPWIHYHEIPEGGHGLQGIPGLADVMIRALLQEEGMKSSNATNSG